MAKKATKAADNVFYKARIEAAACNDELNSREGASVQTGIERTRIARIEENILNPYPEEVIMMSSTYNAPELKAFYCKECCPLGCNHPSIALEDLDRVSVKALSLFRKLPNAKDILLDIVEDGVISEEEKPDLNEFLSIMDEMEKFIGQFKLLAEKNNWKE